MSRPELRDRAPDAALGDRRAEVLSRLRQSAEPLSVTEVATQTRLHVNTARFHLDGLVAEGFADRMAQPRATRGRPRILYAARAEATGPRSYQLLAEMLTGLVADQPDPRAAAVDAGRQWGRRLVGPDSPSAPTSARAAVARLNAMLATVGFEPEVQPGATRIDLRHCPFREVAERHPDVVCAMHLGLMQGALAALRAPVTATALTPFVTPTRCVAQLSEGAPA